ncbi:hypothetical protein [Photobacterium sp. OFAV2-7]|uniref:hypothetical protein n=1 Tax=Photobacterium sp. OFAV2-7 TaxID=2917748 RepID=UPI001EF5A432|nr:hypothetical protein [Photobacterium sp. OFAV2-7]MCG7587266.1 hypothetical protein [Photobacterium sp. OFAV2-7]
MGNKTMSIGKQTTFIGALLAYLIGSGFATGQETMQFFSGWGAVWSCMLVGVITFFMMYLAYSAYAYAGRTRGLNDVSGIFKLYAGTAGGKLFEAFAWSFNASCYMFMVSGFGNVLHQQWGIPIAIGSAVAVVISVGTAAAGLNKMIDIIGRIGPVIVGFTIVVGIISAFEYYPLIGAGNAAINNGEVEVTRAGANPVAAGLSFGGCCLLLVSAMVGRMGSELRDYDFKYTNIIMGLASFAFVFGSIVMGLNHIGNIANASTAAIPNLLLANNIFGAIGGAFAVIILVAVYSTLCPIIWTCVSMFIKDEKSMKYKLTCVIAGTAVYFVTLYVPYQTLLNYIMTYFGYSGAIVCGVVVVRYYMLKAKDKKEGITVSEQTV